MNSCISRVNAKWGLSNSTRFLLRAKNNMRNAGGKCSGLARHPSTLPGMFNISRNISVSSRFYISFVYSISLKTGDGLGSGTDAQVYIRMIGVRGSTDEVMLKTEIDDLERGGVDHYTVPFDDVGEVKEITIRHDNSGFAPGWFLDWVKIHDGRGKKYHFDCNDWLATGENMKLLKETNYQMEPVASTNVDVEKEKSAFEPETVSETSRYVEEKQELEPQTVIETSIYFEEELEPTIVEKKESVVAANVIENKMDDTAEEIESKVLEKKENSVIKSEDCIEMIRLNEFKDVIDNLITSNGINEELLDEGLKVTGEVTVSKKKREKVMKNMIIHEEEVKSSKEQGRHRHSLSPAVRNLLDSFGIDMSAVTASGRDSRLLKGDVLAYMSKENITKKLFSVETNFDEILTEIKRSVDEGESYPRKSFAQDFQDQIQSGDSYSKFDIPHLYMSSTCDAKHLDSFVGKMEQKLTSDKRNSVLAKMLSKSLSDTGIALHDEDYNVLLNSNGNTGVLQNCRYAAIGNMHKQLTHFKDMENKLTTAPYELNVIDHGDVIQLSSVLTNGQLLSLNVNGPKLSIDGGGQAVQCLTLALSFDGRVISEVTGAMLLQNIDRYMSNPSLLML